MKASSGKILSHLSLGLALSVLLLSGCSKKADKLVQQAQAAEKAAQAAEQRNDEKTARLEADKAEQAATDLQKLADEKKSDDELQKQLQQAETAAHLAREYADIATEKKQLRDKLRGVKIMAYEKARGLTLGAVLPPMAAAAESYGKRGTNGTSALEQELAAQAWNFASTISGHQPLIDGRPDWSGVAADFRSWSTNPPMEFRALLGLSLAMAGQGDCALYEFEAVDPAALKSTNALRIYHGGRALLCAMNGWNHLATSEAEAFGRCTVPSDGPFNDKQFSALLHAFLAYDAFKKGESDRMDAELSRSLQAWPDNPAVVYLTGERLAANGEWEKAAASLEAQAAGTQNEAVAKRLAQHARELRDGKGGSKELLGDGRLLVQLAVQSALASAKDSEAARKLSEFLELAKAFGLDFWQMLPSLGGASSETNAPAP